MSTEKRLMDAEGLAAYLSVSPSTARRFGYRSGAVVHVGRRCLFDLDTINREIETIRERRERATVEMPTETRLE